MAERFTYYIDYGAGYVEINPYKNKLKLEWNREFNDFISRKSLKGNFSLIETEADAAVAYFITAGNYEAPFKIYEDGTSITGTLVYEGWAKVKGFYDFSAKVVTIDSFRTNDIYTLVIPLLKVPVPGYAASGSDENISFSDFTVQGLNTNCNKLQGYAWSGTAWAASGNALSLGTVGRVSACNIGTGIAVYDNLTRDLRRYVYTAPNWSLSGLGTSLILSASTGNVAICALTATTIAVLDDFLSYLSIYTLATGTWTLGITRTIEKIKYPSMALLSAGLIAIVDEGTKTLRLRNTNPGLTVTGESYSLSDVEKPAVCTLNSASSRVAVVDAGTSMLRAYAYASLNWTEVGDGINVGDLVEPTLMQVSTDVVTLYDSYLGIMQRYTFSGTAWSATGSSNTIGGGYSSGMALQTISIMGFIQSDSYKFTSSSSRAYVTLLNDVNNYHGIYLNPGYVLNLTGSGVTFDIEKTSVVDLGTVADVFYPDTTGVVSEYNYKLDFLLKLPEIFQNYWYLEYDPSALGDYQFKFTQPNLFSLFGTDIVITDYVSSLYNILNQRTYNDKFEITKEEIKFDNEYNPDFVGDYIEYNRNTPVIETEAIKATTDMKYLVDNTLRTKKDFSKSGIALVYMDTSGGTGKWFVEAGTGISGDTNVKNEELSKSRIQDTYWKDYRYANSGNIDINGSSSAVQDTCRKIIEFPDVQLPLPAFPASIANLDWGSGRKSYITSLSMSLDTYITTIQSRLLDL